MITASLVFLLAAVAAPTSQNTGIPAEARATIAAANADWIPALKSGDVARIAAPYANDGIFVTATGAVVKGRDAIAQLMRDRLTQMGKPLSGEIVQDGITPQGTLIYEWGHATLQLAREAGAPVESSGRYLTVWQQSASGRWEISRNLSLPN